MPHDIDPIRIERIREYHNERILALREVKRLREHNRDPENNPPPSEQFVQRRILRDVAQRLGMPYTTGSVEDMPFAEVLQHHYEMHYMELAEATGTDAEQRWQAELELVTETIEEQEKRLRSEEL